MPKKAEAGSIKDLAKRMKMKGLQKLRFWCEMCQKQCRDANGFKCHLQSEQHLRQMKVFSEQAGSIVQQKSKQFEAAFLETLRLYHSTCQVNANNVYQQVIRDKTHVHMNATMWATLSDFVQYLGKQGKVKVQETPKGWYVQYIPVVSVQERIKQEQQQEQAAADAAAEAALEVQREKARRKAVLEHYHQQQQQQTSDNNNNNANIATVVEATKLERRNSTKEGGSGDGDDDVAATTTMIRLNLPNAATAAIGKKNAIGKTKLKKPPPPSLFDNASDSDDDDDNEQQGLPLPSPPIPYTTSEKKRKADKDAAAAAATTQKISNDAATKPPSSKRTRLDEDNNNNNKKNHHRHQDDSISSSAALEAAAAAVVLNDPQVWLYPGIVVRIIDSTQHEYYKQKAVVQQVSLSNEESETKKKKKIRAQVQLLRQSDNSNNDKHDKTLTFLQKHLETVVPKKQVDHNNDDDDDDNVVVYLAHGKYRGERAIVTKLDKTKYRANLRLLKTNKVLEKVDFEDFSLLAPK